MKRGLRLKLIFFLLASCRLYMYGQTDAQYTQYFAVPAYYNPAVYGNTDYLQINGGARLQWAGIEGAPKDFYLGGGLPVTILDKCRIGAGVEVYRESIGLYRTLEASAQISYKIPVCKGYLSIGVQPGVINQSFRGSDIYIPVGEGDESLSDDPDLPAQDLSGSSFDFGAGIWYSRENWWIGLSGHHLLSPTVTFTTGNDGQSTETTENFEFKAKPSYYFMTGYNIPIKNTLFEIRPSVMLKHSGNFNSAELTAIVGWKKMFSAGLSYRWKDAVSFILSADIDGVYVGYSYDYPISSISRASKGSHELVAGYRLKLNLEKKNKYKYKSIRLM